ncbi:hypothetical protein M413DRAFT_76838 [Hebeloma cylindrosporum]|uniref:ER transporter 6TM N-terminal domain-containing protein n=1 Tax=Hebeloma cylindrosporum TaxID=76867 RepID=A0A0C2XI51_HEBCY|nr:hypothetical protein M413DRAFT_76838 [Hebeloma cylindrosporum h7]
MKEPEEEEAVSHRYPGTFSSPTEKPRASIPQTPQTESTLPPFISNSAESRSSNPLNDSSPDAQAGPPSKRKWRWYPELSPAFYSKLHMEWVRPNLSYPKLRPVIRSAVTAWVCVLLFVFPAFERKMGSASFVIFLAAWISPPSDPFICVFEREMLICVLACISWAWVCLGVFLADRSRTYHNPSLTLNNVASGQYIEAGSSIICAVFIFFGAAFFLWLRVRQGPGPYLFACIFALLALNISLTAAPLYPSPQYLLTKSVVLPLDIHAAIAMFFSVCLFPQTLSRKVEECLGGVLGAESSFLSGSSRSTPRPKEDPDSKPMPPVRPLEPTLIPLAVTSRLLASDLSFSRFAPEDLASFQTLSRRLVGRCTGMQGFWGLIEHGRSRERIPTTPAASSRRASGERSAHRARFGVGFSFPLGHTTNPEIEDIEMETTARMGNNTLPPASLSVPGQGHLRIPTQSQAPSLFEKLIGGHSHSHAHSVSLFYTYFKFLLSDRPLTPRRAEHPVGLFEAQRYHDLEATRLYDPNEEEETRRSLALLRESCVPLVRVCVAGVGCAQKWMAGVRKGRMHWLWAKYWTGNKVEWEKRKDVIVREVEKMRAEMGDALHQFRNQDSRHMVFEPYRPALEGNGENESPPHRYLFNNFVYQYHLIQLASIICEMLDEILRLEALRPAPRLWTPIQRLFPWNLSHVPESNSDGDEDPAQSSPDVEAAQPPPKVQFSIPTPRDPDALPPRNAFESVFESIHSLVSSIGTGNVVFAIKAGLLTIVLCLPSLIKSSAKFAYANKFVWGVFMGQITLARFRGDTAFGLAGRIFSTFFGGCLGMVIWYISAGSTTGNPYGLCTICAVAFPFFFFARLYCPVSPMVTIVLGVTACLVVGYSFQDHYIPTPASPGQGWNVFWRRFLLVTCRVVAAFIASLLPPSSTIRHYQRRLLATAASELGNVYCGIVGFAASKGGDRVQNIVSALLAVRNKLGRAGKSGTVGRNAEFEISLRGRWPAERYQKIVDLQVGISYSLSHLISVLQHLDPAWSRAFLRRTRFMDADFQGDVLAVICEFLFIHFMELYLGLSMVSSSLRTGTPLPHITPSPLIDRFMLKYHGLDVIHRDAEEDYGLPRTLTMDVLRNEEYLMFSVGISTAFGLVNRLDRLMMAVKEVVGEHYYIHGVGVSSSAYGQSADANTESMHTSGGGFYGGAYADSLRTLHRDREKEKDTRGSEARHNGERT